MFNIIFDKDLDFFKSYMFGKSQRTIRVTFMHIKWTQLSYKFFISMKISIRVETLKGTYHIIE